MKNKKFNFKVNVAAVVVTYNRLEKLKKCLQCMEKQARNLDIFIINNASTDETDFFMRSYKKNHNNIFYFKLEENIGGAGGFNFGLKEAYKSSKNYKYFWLLDDDTYPQKNALLELLKFANKNESFGFLVSKAIWKDGSLSEMNVPSIIKRKGNFIKVRQASFVSFFVKRDIFNCLGFPIKEFFIWGDDIEFSRRISSKYNCYWVQNSIVFHDTKYNTGSDIATDDKRIERYRYAYRNEIYIAKKEGLKRKIYQITKLGYHILRVILFSKNNRIQRISIIVKSTIRGLHFNPKVEYPENMK
jgi:GT2 family glycosyltransferase